MSSRIKIEDIQKEIAQYGWKLISDKYENLDSELIFKCAEGHTIYAPWRKLRTKCECPICKKNQQNWNYQQIKPKNKNTYRILAVDQATYNSGFSIFDGNELLRYGIHSDYNYDSDWSYLILKNCVLKNVRDNGFQQAFGAGLGVHSDWLIENCVFKSINDRKDNRSRRS